MKESDLYSAILNISRPNNSSIFNKYISAKTPYFFTVSSCKVNYYKGGGFGLTSL